MTLGSWDSREGKGGKFHSSLGTQKKGDGVAQFVIIIIIITIFIWRPSWSSDHSRRALAHVNFFTLTVTFEHRTNIVAD